VLPAAALVAAVLALALRSSCAEPVAARLVAATFAIALAMLVAAVLALALRSSCAELVAAAFAPPRCSLKDIIWESFVRALDIKRCGTA
jgi:Na+(H+)/acetate symporter ActP